MRIAGKVALITGASEGIGAALAAELALAGARLSLTARSEEGLRRAAPSAETLITPGDLTTEETRRLAVERTLEAFGRIDILVNNAGAGVYLPSWSVPPEDARSLFELNWFAPLDLVRLVTPHMRRQGGGVIVNVGSIAGKATLPWLTVYSASKSALGSLTEGLRMELREASIHAMLVCPGYVQTRFQQNARGGSVPEKVARARRFAITPEACAAAIRRGIERGARTVYAPRAAWLLAVSAALFPAATEARMARMNGTA
jgi:short-subunit dehydrogenase